MKNFASTSFFRLFDLMLSTGNTGLKVAQWEYGGAEWVRDRYSLLGPAHGIVIEIFTVRKTGRHGWSFMVTKENWWAGQESQAIKSTRWARPLTGRRTEIMQWLRDKELELDRALPGSGH